MRGGRAGRAPVAAGPWPAGQGVGPPLANATIVAARRLLGFLLLLVLPAAPAAAYSVLTHQSLIDSAWDGHLRPLLSQRYPGATPAQWDEARSYAYGGAIVQDMGYYPLGNRLFTNLTHYVRTGDFVRNLLAGAHDRNEYAFALGALAHYAADNVGHPEATNLVLPAVYPRQRAQYGPVVTYEQAPANHTEVEFGFDVVQLAAGRYRTQAYHKHIGFRVSKPLLKRVFAQTYGLELRHVYRSLGVSTGAYRLTVNQLLPLVARAAWFSQRREIEKISPRARYRDAVYRASSPAQQRRDDQRYGMPGRGARLLAHVLNLLPKIGPLRDYAFRLPSAEGEARFSQSYRAALARYEALVVGEQAAGPAPTPLPNTNLDTGQPTRPTDYILADATYGQLLRTLRRHHFEHLTPALRQQMLAFYAVGPPPSAPPARYTKATAKAQQDTPRNRRRRQQAQAALAALPSLAP